MTITGSEAASVLPAPWNNPYKSRKQLFLEKSVQKSAQFSNYATQHGTYYEDEALGKYMERTGERALLFGLIAHPTISWIGGSPDAITPSGRLVEIKVHTCETCGWLYLPRHDTTLNKPLASAAMPATMSDQNAIF
jgi:hypothetical protein